MDTGRTFILGKGKWTGGIHFKVGEMDITQINQHIKGIQFSLLVMLVLVNRKFSNHLIGLITT